jgi:hypothetical protein
MCKHDIKTKVIHSFGPYRKKGSSMYFLLTFLFGGNLHTPWSCCIVGGSKSQVHRPGSITGPSSIGQGPMSRAAAEVVATEQTAAAREETAEEVIDEVLATAGAEVADLLASKGVTISPAILTLGADVVLQQYSPLSIDGLPDFSQYLFIFLLNA